MEDAVCFPPTQQARRETREMLGGYRRRLATVAERLYPEFVVPGLDKTGVIAHPSWLPSEPMPLRSVVLGLERVPWIMERGRGARS